MYNFLIHYYSIKPPVAPCFPLGQFKHFYVTFNALYDLSSLSSPFYPKTSHSQFIQTDFLLLLAWGDIFPSLLVLLLPFVYYKLIM